MNIEAVIFDLGGVVFPSPFEAFDAYDVESGLAPGTVRALIKTSSERFPAARDAIRAMHSYELPECIAINIADGSPDYLKWLAESLPGWLPGRSRLLRDDASPLSEAGSPTTTTGATPVSSSRACTAR